MAAHETLMELKNWSNLICNSERPTKFVIVQRCFDSTPSKMSFGSLASKLAPVARYYHLNSAGDWQLLGFDEYRKATKSRSFKHGSLEMLAQTLTAHWDCFQGDFRVNMNAKFILPPLILPDLTSSTLYAALHRCGGLGLSDVQRLTEKVSMVLLVLDGDGLSANLRANMAVQEQAAAHNASRGSKGLLLILTVCCAGHIMNRMCATTFAWSRVIGRMHAVAFSASRTSNYNRLIRAILHLVQVGLDIIPCERVPDDHKKHAAKVMHATLLRPLRTRARQDVSTANSERLRKVVANLVEVANGDWRGRRLVHYCPGCCRSRMESVGKMSSALIDALVDPLATSEPSTNKWWTCEKAMVTQGAGLMCHQVGQQAHELAYENTADESDNEDQDVDSYKLYCNKKKNAPAWSSCKIRSLPPR